MNKKIRLVSPAVIIILLISILSAFVCTYLMKRIKNQDFIDAVGGIYLSIDDNLALNYNPKGGEREKKLYKYEMERIVADRASNLDFKDEYFDYAVLLYDYATNKTVISDPRIVISEDLTIHLSDYLNKEEIISYATDFRRSIYSKGGLFKVYLNSNDIPITIETTGLPPFTQIKLMENETALKWDECMSYFPKRGVEKEMWIDRFTEWMNNEKLQSELQKAKERIEDVEPKTSLSDSLIIYETMLFDKFFENGSRKEEPYCNIIIIATYHPWLAAIRDMKPVYIMISLVSLVCIIFVSKNTLDTYDRQTKLEDTKSSFIAAMAHDLKTPLTVIRGYSENMLDNGDIKNKESLQKIINKTDEVNDMVSKMLEISKLDSGSFEVERKELILNDILKKAIDNYSQAAEERSLSFHLKEKDSFKMVGDENLLEKLFSNLIDNAVSYGKEGSEIAIDIDRDKISICNEADPIKEEKLKNIFEVKSGSNGHHGFGLYFAKKVADIHGLQLSIGNVNKGVRTVLSIDKHQTKLKGILLAKSSV